MAIANPAAKFNRQHTHNQTRPLTRSAFERRSVCVLPKSLCMMVDSRKTVLPCAGKKHKHFTRRAVEGQIASGEMRWVDRHHNVATYVTSETWQKTPSGGVHTMQLVEGLKGRHIPATQRETLEPQAY